MRPPEPRLSGESDQQYESRVAELRQREAQTAQGGRKVQQTVWFDSAREVFVAEVVAIGSQRLADGFVSPKVTLQSVRWLKGSGAPRRFDLTFESWTSCGPIGGGDAPVFAKLGGLFVVYDVGSAASARGELNVAAANVLDPRVRAMLVEAGNLPDG